MSKRPIRYIMGSIILFLPYMSEAQAILNIKDNWVTDNKVSASVYDPIEKKTYIGGAFRYVGPRTGAAAIVDADGQLIDKDLQVDGSVYTTESDGQGGYFIGGQFSHVEGLDIQNVAHILADGSVDPDFAPNPNKRVWALAHNQQSIFIGGEFTTIGGQPIARLAKVSDSLGDVDATFTPNPSAIVYSLAAADFSLYVGGCFKTIEGQSQTPRLAKIELDTGSSFIDSNFHPTPNACVTALKYIGLTQTLYTGGFYNQIDGSYDTPYLSKLNANTGVSDKQFAPKPNGHVLKLILDDQRLYVAGRFSQMKDNREYGGLARVDAVTGEIDANFKSGYMRWAYDVQLDKENHKIYVGGHFHSIQNQPNTKYFARLDEESGLVDSTFKGNAIGPVWQIRPLSNNYLVAGAFNSIGGQYDVNNLARLNEDGSLDDSFTIQPNGQVTQLKIKDRALYIYGYYSKINETNFNKLARMDLDTLQLDPQFKPNALSPADSMLITDDSLYLGGRFRVRQTPEHSYLTKYDLVTGANDLTFQPSVNGPVRVIIEQGQNLMIGGSFTSVGFNTRPYLAKIDQTKGEIQHEFLGSFDGAVNALSLVDNKLFVGGIFLNYLKSDGSSVSMPYIAQLDPQSGELNENFKPSPDRQVYSIFPTDNSLVIGGVFKTLLNGQVTMPYLAKIDFQNNVDQAFKGYLSSPVTSINVTDNKLQLLGYFSSIFKVPSNTFAELELSSQ